MPDGLIPRGEVFDTYWYFAYERLMMFYRRLDEQVPVTDDPILAKYKFCNTYRICDRVTQYLVRNVQYNKDWSGEDMLFRTVLFRLFSWPDTWEAIGGDTLCVRTYNSGAIEALLEARMRSGDKLYTSAFILSGLDAYGQGRKYKNHLRLVEQMIADNLPEKVSRAGSLKEVYEQLIAYPMIGRFMAYQIAIDLNYSTLIDFDESSFVVAGPGAQRGIKKCFVSTGGLNDEAVIMYMVDSQNEHFDRLGLKFPGLYGRPLQAIDCQGLFCETDKYSRVKFPELASARTHIKSKYRPSSESLGLFFPSKWGLG